MSTDVLLRVRGLETRFTRGGKTERVAIDE